MAATVVADEVLSRAIAELRTMLGDDAREARYVETLPKILPQVTRRLIMRE